MRGVSKEPMKQTLRWTPACAKPRRMGWLLAALLLLVSSGFGRSCSIPVEYPGPDGTDYKLFVKVDSVTDENGEKIRFEQSTRSERTADGRFDQFLVLRIYAGGTDTERTVRITYRSANAVRFFKDHDEFYWNVTGLDTK